MPKFKFPRNRIYQKQQRRRHLIERLEARELLISDFHNPANRLDVNADGFVSPMDALLIINELNRDQSQFDVTLSETTQQTAFWDVNDDSFATPIDALLVINHLNNVIDPSGTPIATDNGATVSESMKIENSNVEDFRETKLNSTTKHLQETPSVAITNEGFVAVWVSHLQDGSASGIVAQRHDTNGRKVGPEFVVTSRTRHAQRAPAIDSFPDGSFVVVWESDSQDGSGIGVFARIFSPIAVPKTGDIQINQSTDGTQRAPSIAVLTNGNFVVGWEGKGTVTPWRDDSYGVFMRVFDAAGIGLTNEYRVNDVGSGHQEDLVVAKQLGGGFAVAWNGNGGGDNNGIFLRQFDQNGLPIASEILVNPPSASDQRQADISTDENGRIAVAWASTTGDGSGWSVFLQQFWSDGSRIAGPVRVNQKTTGTQWKPEVGYVGANEIIVAWEGYGFDDTDGVHQRRLTRTSEFVGGQAIVSATTRGRQLGVNLDTAVNGSVVAWHGRGEGDFEGVFARSYIAQINDVHPPTIKAIGDMTVDELTQLSVQIDAMDPDSSSQALSYFLGSGPIGAVVDPRSGQLTWLPSELQGPGVYAFDVTVRDSATPAHESHQSFRVTVNEVNQPPTIAREVDLEINEMEPFRLPIRATDSDHPSQILRYQLLSGPDGVAFDASTGELEWTPLESQGPGTYSIEVQASDGVADSEPMVFSVSVMEVNLPPAIADVPPQSVQLGHEFTWQLTASDPDIPSNMLLFDMQSGPSGAQIDPNGQLRWTPSANDVGQVVQIQARVTDNGVPVLSDETSISIAVIEESCAFSQDLAGWSVTQTGGSVASKGEVAVTSGCDALMTEGDSFTVTLETSFIFPENVQSVSFEYDDLLFDTVSTNLIRDAFEVALLDSDRNSLVPTYASGRDSFLNVTEGLPIETSSTGVSIQGREVSLDTSKVPRGSLATLVFRLVNNDDDGNSTVRVKSVSLPTAILLEPAAVSNNGNGDPLQSSPISDVAVNRTSPVMHDRSSRSNVVESQKVAVAATASDSLPIAIKWRKGAFPTTERVPTSNAFSIMPESNQVMMTPVVIDLDHDHLPEIIFSTFAKPYSGSTLATGLVRAVRGTTGEEFWTNTDVIIDATSGIAAGDIDDDGNIEIVGLDSSGFLVALAWDGRRIWRSDERANNTFGGAPAIANLDGIGAPEIVIGASVFDSQGHLRNRGKEGIGTNRTGGPLSIVADVDLDGRPEIIAGNSVYDSSGVLLRKYLTTDGASILKDGFTAIGNLDDDVYPEIVLVSDGKVSLLQHDNLQASWTTDIPEGGFGGAPTIADIDGDGRPDITVAGYSRYIALDHDGRPKWPVGVKIIDHSSHVTGSSVFDFDNDGSSEIVYGDEVAFFIFRGADGHVLASIDRGSGTVLELPVVADVNGDGTAEIVVVANDYYKGSGSGVIVIQSGGVPWSDTRPIWNQHSYHITNINDDGSIPDRELNSWQLYNNYRRNRQVTGTLIGPPSITASTPWTSTSAGTSLVLSGQATANQGETSRESNHIVSVTVNDIAVDVLDNGGSFFSKIVIQPGVNEYDVVATDATGQNASTTVKVTGTTQERLIDFSRFADITGSFGPLYGRTSFNRDSRLLHVDLATRNDGSFAADTPLLVGVKNITDRTVSVVGSDGITPEGIPYFDLSKYVTDHRLDTGEASGSPTIRFLNPGENQFRYDLVFYGRLNQPPAFTTIPMVEALVGKSYTYDANAIDADDVDVSFKLDLGPSSSLPFDEDSGVLTWTPTAADVGSHDITIRASDGRGGVAEQHFVVSVITPPPNRPPVITSPPVTSVEQGILVEPLHRVPTDIITYGANDYIYLVGPTGFRPGFESVDHDDSGFKSGSGGFGTFGNFCKLPSEVRTEWPINTDLLVRRNVRLPNGTNNVRLFLSIDNRAQVYWNGVELTNGYFDGGGCASRDQLSLVVPIELMREGDNVLAVRGNDYGSVSFFDLRLIGDVPVSYIYDVEALDADQDEVVYSLETRPDGMDIDPDSGEVTWTPTIEQIGLHDIKIKAIDGRGGTVFQEFVLCVHAADRQVPAVDSEYDLLEVDLTSDENTSPKFDPVTVNEASYGEGYEFAVVATDAEGDPLLYTLITGPAGMELNRTTGAVSWRPHRSQLGEHNVVVRAEDGLGGIALQSFTLQVVAPNTAPVFTSIPVMESARGRHYVYNVKVQDAEGDSIALSLDPGSIGTLLSTEVRSLNGDLLETRHRVEWIPSEDELAAGKGRIVLRAADGRGGVTLQTTEVIVVPEAVNIRPQIESTAPTTAYNGLPFTYLVRAIDQNADRLRYSLDPEATPPEMSISEEGVISWIPPISGTTSFPVRVFVSDGIESSGHHFTIMIASQAANHPPAIVSNPPPSGRERKTFEYNARAEDGDKDVLRWSLDSGPVGMSIDMETGAIRWTPRFDQLGMHQVALRVTDPFLESSLQSFTIDVTCTNVPPLITSTPPTQAAVGDSYFYALRAIEPEGDELAFSLLVRPNDAMTISSTGMIRWVPGTDDAGRTITVVVRAEDNDGGVAVQEYQIEVLEAGARNRPPVITSTPHPMVTIGDTYTYQVDANDADGDTLMYSLPRRPEWLSIEPKTGLITGKPTSEAEDSVVIEVSDGSGTATQGFAINIRTNRAPTIDSTARTSATAGDVYRYSVRATDPDGDPVSYLLESAPLGMTIDGFGRIIWEVPADYPDSSPSQQAQGRIRVSDTRGALDTEDFTITVSADTEAPLVELFVGTGDIGALGQTLKIENDTVLTFRVLATDNVDVTSRNLSFIRPGGNVAESLTLDSSNRSVLRLSAPGLYEFVATARDAAGNTGETRRRVRVVDPNSGVAVRITSPGDFATITNTALITAELRAGDPSAVLESYRVLYARAKDVQPSVSDDAQFNYRGYKELSRHTFATGIHEFSGEVARFDPTLLENDTYVILVEAFDDFGNQRVEPVYVNVSGELKLGNFRLEVTDLSLPLAGIPITIKRVYDTLQADEEGDFGYGWSLGISDAKIRETVPAGADFESVELNPVRPTKVYLTKPDGRRVGFTYHEQVLSCFLGCVYQPYFVPDIGVFDSLSVDGLSGEGGLQGDDFGGANNWDVYTLTTPDGTKYKYDQNAGLQSIVDTSGNTLLFGPEGVTRNDRTEVTFHRDGRGRIERISYPDVDNNNQPVTRELFYGYDAALDLRSFSQPVDDTARLTTQFSYNLNYKHYLEEIVDPRGILTSKTEYDEQGRIKRIIDANGKEVVFDRNGRDQNLERITDARNVSTVLQYDEFGNVKEKRQGEHLNQTGQTVFDSIRRYAYIYDRDGVDSPNRDKEWKVTQVFTDASGNETNAVTTEYDYDSAGNVTKVIDTVDGERLERGFVYNSFNKVTRVTDEAGRVTVFDYDAKGNLREIVNATGGKSFIEYDDQGRPTKYTDFRGFSTRFEYDGSQSQPARIFNPDDTVALPSVRQLEYNSRGQVTKSIDEEQILTEYRYDAAGQKIYERIGQDAPVRYVYENNLQTRKIIRRSEVVPGSKDIVTVFGYTDTGLLQYETDAMESVTGTDNETLGAVTGYEYDAAGNRTFLGRWNSKADYDVDQAAAEQARKLDPQNPSIFAGRYPKATFEHVFVYDRLGRVDYELDDVQLDLAEKAGIGLSHITVKLDHDYDSVGNRVQTVDRNGRVRTFQYDERNRLVGEQWLTDLADTVADRSFVWEYNTAGNLERATEYEGVAAPGDPSKILSRYTYTYDTLNRVRSVDNAGTKDMPQVELTYDYDDNGNRISVTDSLGVAVKSTYDSRNRLDTRWWDNETGVLAENAVDEVLVEVDYYLNGREKSLTRYTGDAVVEANRVGQTLYAQPDASGRIQKISHQNAAGEILAEYIYGFDKLGLVDTLAYDNATAEKDGVRDSYDFFVDYRYDDLGQLTDADYSDATTDRGIYLDEFYRYDKNGNRIDGRVGGSIDNYATDTGNRVTSDGTFIYKYDAEGNQVRREQIGAEAIDYTIYRYDHRNRLTEIEIHGASKVVLITNVYDMDGKRVGTETREEVDTTSVVTSVQRIVHNGDDTWADFTGPGPITSRYLFGDRIDQVLGRFEAAGNLSAGISWYLTDQLGTTIDVTTPSGSLASHFSYEAFGGLIGPSRVGTSERFLFTGRELFIEERSPLYYYRARSYDAGLGRFISTDTLGYLAEDENLYRYVGNQPISVSDPTGQISMVGYTILFAVSVAASATEIYYCESEQGSVSAIGAGGLLALNASIPLAVVWLILSGDPAGATLATTGGTAAYYAICKAIERGDFDVQLAK